MNVLKNETDSIVCLFWLMVKVSGILALIAMTVIAITPVLTIFLVLAALITLSIGVYDRLAQ